LKIIEFISHYNAIFTIDREMVAQYGEKQRVNNLSENKENTAI
jgi:hypothetical protein